MSRPVGLILLTLTLSSGCYRAARYDVVQQGPAALIANHRAVYVAPVELGGQLFDQEFRTRLVALLGRAGQDVVDAPVPDALIVRARVLELDPGFWAFVGSDAKIRMRVELTDDPAAAPLDVIELHDRVKADLWSVTPTNRIERLASTMADLTARYVRGRSEARTHGAARQVAVLSR